MSKTILITGAASGFGKIAAFDLAKKGHKVIATAQVYPQMSDLIREAKEQGIEMIVDKLDVTNTTDIAYITQKYDIDILISNAGIMEAGPIADVSSSDEVKMSALHQIVEQSCLALIRVFTGYTPNHFALEYLFMLCEYFTSITADFFPRQTKEEKSIFKLLKQQPNTLRFSKCNDVDYILYQLLEERCGKFRKQADIMIQNEIERLDEAENATEKQIISNYGNQ